MRPYWTGQIRLSLVSLPVEIYPAVSSYKTIPLHQLYRLNKKRIQHQNVVDDEPVEKEDIVKGYEYKKGNYVILEKEEIDAVKIASSNVLEIVQFIDAQEIDPLYFDKPYYVVPKNDAAEEAFVTIREALKESKKYGLGQIVMAGRERLCALKACGRGMMLDLIRYKDEVREADKYFEEIDEIKVGKDQMDLAKQLIKQKSAKFNPGKFHDHYLEGLQELIDSKVENREPEYEEAKPQAKVINLMDALKKSLAEKNKKEKTKISKKPTSKKTSQIKKPKRS